MTTIRCLALALTLAACGTTPTPCAPPTPSRPAWAPEGYRACITEDDVICYWDAATRGNGQGRSFFVTLDGKVHYITLLP